jgi:hypothetical protein
MAVPDAEDLVGMLVNRAQMFALERNSVLLIIIVDLFLKIFITWI